MRSEFEEWFKTTEAYKLIEEMNYFKVDLFTFKEHRSQYQHSAVQIAYMTYQHQQSKVDELRAKFDQHDQWLGQRNGDVQELYDINVKHAAEKAELQKRVDDLTQVMEELLEEMKYPTATFEEVICSGVRELEQALKGEGQ